MSSRATQLCTFAVRTRDGDGGTVHDLYFDDQDWSVCYVVVSVGRWPFDRRILVPPPVLREPDEEEEVLAGCLECGAVERVP